MKSHERATSRSLAFCPFVRDVRLCCLCIYQVTVACKKPLSQGQRVFDIIENGIACPKATEIPGGRADVLRVMKENARIFVVWNSILASTRQSYKTHVRSWLRFCSETLGKDSEQFVIELEEVTLWSCNFSNVGTFKNYLAGLQWSCDLLGVPTAVFADPLIRSCCVSWHCILRR